MHCLVSGSVIVYRIDHDNSITWISDIMGGKREEAGTFGEQPLTYRKIK